MGLAAFFVSTPVRAGAASAAAQSAPPSLAELARKEAERRKTTKESKRVITSKDLPESARKPASAPADGGAAATPTATASTGQKPAANGDAPSPDEKGEAAWRGRITQAREALRRNEVFLEAMQTRVSSLFIDAQNRPSAVQQEKLRDDAAKAAVEMARVKADLEASKKQVFDIEEEARKAGVPPGWLR